MMMSWTKTLVMMVRTETPTSSFLLRQCVMSAPREGGSAIGARRGQLGALLPSDSSKTERRWQVLYSSQSEIERLQHLPLVKARNSNLLGEGLVSASRLVPAEITHSMCRIDTTTVVMSNTMFVSVSTLLNSSISLPDPPPADLENESSMEVMSCHFQCAEGVKVTLSGRRVVVSLMGNI